MALLKVNTGRRVLNRITKSVVESMRGDHPTHLFSYQGHPVTKMNNSAWKRIRVMVGLKQVRVHDWKHTFGRRLRAAGVPLETRKVLLGHRNGDITSHYSAPELEELLVAAERVCEDKSGIDGAETKSGKRHAANRFRPISELARPERLIRNRLGDCSPLRGAALLRPISLREIVGLPTAWFEGPGVCQGLLFIHDLRHRPAS